MLELGSKGQRVINTLAQHISGSINKSCHKYQTWMKVSESKKKYQLSTSTVKFISLVIHIGLGSISLSMMNALAQHIQCLISLGSKCLKVKKTLSQHIQNKICKPYCIHWTRIYKSESDKCTSLAHSMSNQSWK